MVREYVGLKKEALHGRIERQRGKGEPVSAHRPDQRVSRTRHHLGQAPQRGADRRRRLEGHSGDAVPRLDSRYARVHPGWHEGTPRRKRETSGLVMWQVVFAKHAVKDAKKLS